MKCFVDCSSLYGTKCSHTLTTRFHEQQIGWKLVDMSIIVVFTFKIFVVGSEKRGTVA